MNSRRRMLGALIGVAALAVSYAAAQEGRYHREIFPDVDVTHDVKFGEAPRMNGEIQTLRMDVYEPAGDESTARPVFIYAHGGFLQRGDKAEGERLCSALARRGWVAASMNYRLIDRFIEGPSFTSALSPELVQGIRDAQHDMQAAVRWFRKHAVTIGVDTERIAVAGYSAGSAVAMMTTFNPDDPGDSGNPGFPSEVAAGISISGGMLEPQTIDAGEPPVLIVHAIDDTTAPYPYSTASVCLPTLLQGNVCESITYPSGGHNFARHFHALVGASVDFLCEHVADCD